jgi:ATP-dependent exoDNAse (exonuclease V) beta subunit
MTVHKAKGLEFPVVILADMTAKETLEQPSRWVDAERGVCAMRLAGCAPPELIDHAAEEMNREREEAIRVLYVAATRARDLLVVPAVGDERREGWLAALHPAIYPEPQRARAPITNQPPGSPEFGSESCPGRPDSVQVFASVSPGLHRPEVGDHVVAWWDPNCLELDVRESFGLAQTRILETDERGERSDAGLRAYGAWRERRGQVRAEAAKPSLTVVPATTMAEDETIRIADIAVESIPAARQRPRGVRFGSLVHAVLAEVGLDDDKAAITAFAELQARLLGASDSERDAAIEAVIQTLAHPLMRRAAEAARAGRCRRETPIVLRLESGTLVECVADLAFEEKGSWIVVDFKTDAELGDREPGYRRQLALYSRGVAEATGAKVKAILLRV